jgi:hypothetical protein
MRSLIILEVEHEDDLDCFQDLVDAAVSATSADNYTVRIDVPECFVLDTGQSPCYESGDCVRTSGGIIHSSECYTLIMEDAPDTNEGKTCGACQGINGAHFLDCRFYFN